MSYPYQQHPAGSYPQGYYRSGEESPQQHHTQVPHHGQQYQHQVQSSHLYNQQVPSPQIRMPPVQLPRQQYTENQSAYGYNPQYQGFGSTVSYQHPYAPYPPAYHVQSPVQQPFTSLPLQSPRPESSSQPTAAQLIIRPPPVAIPRIISQQQQSDLPDQVVQPAQEDDLPSLLIALAEEAFRAAHRKGNAAARCSSTSESRNYYKLIGFGLACFETVLNKFKSQIQPRPEAFFRLRFASILYEETDNFSLAESVLTKGIALSERNRFVDIKYAMQHLLVCVIHATNLRAAVKSLDGIIADVEAYDHTTWVYAFRFLRATLSPGNLSHAEATAALANLRAVSILASEKGDTAVFIVATILEAQTHLRSAQADCVEQAQRALAMARTFQLDGLIVSQIPQAMALASIMDLACALKEVDGGQQGSSKMNSLHSLLDGSAASTGWKVASFNVPVSSSRGRQVGSGNDVGPICLSPQGIDQIRFKWLSKQDAYLLSHLLSGSVVSIRNSVDGHKAESFFQEGLRLAREQISNDSAITSAHSAAEQNEWRSQIACFINAHHALIFCARSDWSLARTRLEQARQLLRSHSPAFLNNLLLYIGGTIDQATGHLANAQQVFETSQFMLQREPSSDPCVDLAILANLNLVLILQNRNDLLSDLEQACSSHPNYNIRAAFSVVKAALQPNNAIINTKNALQQALSVAKTLSNSQLISMTLNILSARFFSGVVGEQAEKMAKAGLRTAQQAGNSLWISVAESMLADTLEVKGKISDANEARARAYNLSATIVPALQAANAGWRS